MREGKKLLRPRKRHRSATRTSRCDPLGSADDDPPRMTACTQTNEPAIQQVGDDQARLVIVPGEPRDGTDEILKGHQVLLDTIFHIATYSIRRMRWSFRFKILVTIVSREIRVRRQAITTCPRPFPSIRATRPPGPD